MRNPANSPNQPMFNDCDEEAELLRGQTYAKCGRRALHLVDLSVELDTQGGAVASTDYYVYVWDGNFDGTAVPPESARKLPPMKIQAGQTKNWCPRTAWTPFRSGITVAISSSDSSFVATGFTFNVFYHVVYDHK